jgi:hypothetical protein
MRTSSEHHGVAKVAEFEITWFAKVLSLQHLLKEGHIIPAAPTSDLASVKSVKLDNRHKSEISAWHSARSGTPAREASLNPYLSESFHPE